MRETVVVRLTGAGVGAIAVVLVAGERAVEVVEKVTGGKAAALKVGGVVHARMVNAAGETVDDAMVVRVGEERVELHVHGGSAVVAAVMKVVEEAGVRAVDLDEAARLGVFGEGIAGEVMLALPLAKTMTAARLIAAQAEDGLTRWAKEWRAKVEHIAAGELWRLHSAAQWVLQRSRSLQFLLEPPRVAIVGAPNAGKSTLANALLGRQVAITSDIAGTTRDWVDALATFVAGDVHVAVTLVDTAGVRETQDVLELESITRTHQQAHGADVIVLLFDGSHAITREERALLQRYTAGQVPAVIAVNKCDLATVAAIDGVRVSGKTGAGLQDLMHAVLRQLDLAEIAEGEPFAFAQRQRELLAQLALSRDSAAALRVLDALQANSL